MNEQLRIALIDDNPVWVEALAEYFRAKGLQVRTALDGLKGLSLLEQGGVAAAVVDYHMPGLNGLELLRELRQRQLSVPVVLVSGNPDAGLSRRAHEVGAFAYLTKTASPRLLLEAVEQAVKQNHHPSITHRWGALVPFNKLNDFTPGSQQS